jgi:ribosomal protein S18 acetylase RimI-like enzyme
MSGDQGHQTTDFIARAIEDKAAFAEMMREVWGSDRLVVGMALYDVTAIDATGLYGHDGELHAVASWTLRNTTGYLCALHAITTGGGHAKQLLEEVKLLAKARGARMLRAMVSNDNMPGFIFYQKNGFRFSNLYVGAVDAYRPSVPSLITHGYLGIPVHDALELEIEL